MRISSKLSLIVVGAFLIVGAIGLFSVQHLSANAEAAAAAQARNLAQLMAGSVSYQLAAEKKSPSAGGADEEMAALQRIVEFLSHNGKYGVEVFDYKKNTIADVARGDVGKRIEPARMQFLAAALHEGAVLTYSVTDAGYNGESRQAVAPIKDPSRRIVAALILNYTPLYVESMDLARSSLLVAVGLTLGGLALAILGGRVLSRQVSLPIRQLRDAAVAVASSTEDVSVDIASRDEIGELGRAFNAMTQALAVNRDTLLRRAEQLSYQASYDALTGLANRNLLQDRLQQAIANSARRGDGIVVLFIDLDNFKVINDSKGHKAGDVLLCEAAARLRSCVRESDTVARLGGDEFVLLLMNQQRDQAAAAVHNAAEGASLESDITVFIQKLLAAFAKPMLLGQEEAHVGCSVGVSIFPQDGTDAETLLKNADAAMYRAKELGRNGFQFFTQDLHRRAMEQMQLGTRLRQALEREEFELYYQPQVSLRSGRIVGMEALVRWNHPQRGLVGPGEFIQFAEHSGLILPIGEWILKRACRQNKEWQDAGLPQLPVSVNVSAKQCAQQEVDRMVAQALAESGLAPQYLEIELTESLSMADPEKSVPLMNRLKEVGVKLAIDDFGTGYSNMSYLKRFPVDRLKLDISFVREIISDAGSLAISDAIITMSHSLRLEVVAEGVETEGQLKLLNSRHCDLIQGYYFSRPLPATDLAAMLRRDRRLPEVLTGRTADAPAILVLDDDPRILRLLELVLGQEGYVLLMTHHAEEAFEMLARREVAVVLSDQSMPGMSGVEFLTRVRSMYPDTLRILLSAYEDIEATRQAINRGAIYKFIEKPWRREELTKIVEEAYRGYRQAAQTL